MPPEIVVDKPENLAETLAALLEAEGRRAMAARGRFAMALAGGSVAGEFFPRLARVPLDWGRTEFFWCDERAVPPSDPESNFGIARSLWLEPAAVPEGRIHRMEAEAHDPQRAAAAYSETLARILGSPPRLDLVLLGVGPDGHVCSLFPGHPLLREGQAWVAVVEDSPKPPARRMTLTLPVVGAAGLVVIAALGEAKAEVLRRAVKESDTSLPVGQVLHLAQRCVLLVDPEAADLLWERSP